MAVAGSFCLRSISLTALPSPQRRCGGVRVCHRRGRGEGRVDCEGGRSFSSSSSRQATGGLRRVRGTKDLYGDELGKYTYLRDTFKRLAEQAQFHEIECPLLEHSNLFRGTLGDTSDVVTKEMYTIPGSKPTSDVSLRPEGTAGIMRAFLDPQFPRESLTEFSPGKYYYEGPMFRYERPQAGRSRQFHQLGIELIGSAQPSQDVSLLSLSNLLLEEWGLLKDCKLLLNTLGDRESRQAYQEVLTEYFEKYRDQLSKVSLSRLDQGRVLRILDSKDKADIELAQGAPSIHENLTDASLTHWDEVKRGLDSLGITYEVEPKLVRGLDYYTHTCFEYTSTLLGGQSAVLGGGRYDNLANRLDSSQHYPAVGWAIGLERAAMLLSPTHPPLLKASQPLPHVAVVAVADEESDWNDKVRATAMKLNQSLLSSSIPAQFIDFESGPSRVEGGKGHKSRKIQSLRKQLMVCERQGSAVVIIVGREELCSNALKLRNMRTREQLSVRFTDSIQGGDELEKVIRSMLPVNQMEEE